MVDRKLTDVELERHLAGELPEAQLALATASDRTRLGELRAEHEAYLRSVDVDNEVKRIAQRVARADEARPTRAAWLRWLVPASALAAAAAVLLVFLRRGDHGNALPGEDDMQVKGDEVTLVVHLATDGTSKRLANGDGVKPGDHLRFEINAGKPGYVALVGIDGSGQPTVYHPDGGGTPAAFDPAKTLVPGAIELDATPGDERFFAVYARSPFVIDEVVAGLAGRGVLPPGVAKAEVVLHKAVP